MEKPYPEADEFVICTVTNIQPHCVFAMIDEYGRTGMIHISEVAPGRIRNIKEYVTEGKKIICRILKIDKERGYIDLSLRRVNEAQRRAKLNQIKQQKLAETIVEQVARKLKKEPADLQKTLALAATKEETTLFELFEAVSADKYQLEKIVEKAIAAELTSIIKNRIKPPEVMVKGTLKVFSYEPNGVEIIHEAFNGINTETVHVNYVGGGAYQVAITAKDYKIAELVLEKLVTKITEFMEEKHGVAEFTRAA